jgi:hypothetical protein
LNKTILISRKHTSNPHFNTFLFFPFF